MTLQRGVTARQVRILLDIGEDPDRVVAGSFGYDGYWVIAPESEGSRVRFFLTTAELVPWPCDETRARALRARADDLAESASAST